MENLAVFPLLGGLLLFAEEARVPHHGGRCRKGACNLQLLRIVTASRSQRASRASAGRGGEARWRSLVFP